MIILLKQCGITHNHHELPSMTALIIKKSKPSTKLLQNKVMHHTYDPGLMLSVYFHQKYQYKQIMK